MIRMTLLILTVSTSSVYAQSVAENATATQASGGAAEEAAAAGVTGFVPLVAPALGVVAAAAGVAIAGGGGGDATNSTTSTVSTN